MADSIVWDIVEAYVDEAEFLFQQWERALHSPLHTLGSLRETIEPRLEAHLDALLLGERPVAERCLVPELENAVEPRRATVAALVLLCSNEQAVSPVLEATLAAEGGLQAALIRGLVLAPESRLDPMILPRFREAETEQAKALWLEVLNGRGVDPGNDLRPCLHSDDPRLLSAALASLRRFAHTDLVVFAEQRLQSDHTCVRNEAIKAGLAFGSRDAWDLCRSLARTPEAIDLDLLTLLAALGGPNEHRNLFALLDAPEKTARALWVLGVCGTAEAADQCLPWLQAEDQRLAKAAAATLSWIGGFDLFADDYQVPESEPDARDTLPPLEAETSEAELIWEGMDDLPVPNREAIVRWWAINRDRVARDGRHLDGRPFSREAVVQALKKGPLWRRHGVALELSIRSRGQQHVSTDAFTSRQAAQIATLG